MHAVHNARITLLATALNNLALAVIVAGCIAPAINGQLAAAGQVVTTFAWIAAGTILHFFAQGVPGRVATVTWDQIVVWIIMPLVGSVIVGAGALWASRHIP